MPKTEGYYTRTINDLDDLFLRLCDDDLDILHEIMIKPRPLIAKDKLEIDRLETKYLTS